MARARNIKPGFFKNYDLADCGPVAQLLFAGLWCLADREGRLEDKPRFIKAELFPYYDVDVNGELTVIARLNFIRRYSKDGVQVIEIVNFKKHQAPHHTEKKSSLPAWEERDIASDCFVSTPEINGELTVNSPLQDGGNPPDSLIPDSLIPDSLIPDSLIHVPRQGVSLVRVHSDIGFDQFYEAYPKKTGRADALKAWKKLNPSPALINRILSDISQRIEKGAWCTGKGKAFIPGPAPYLNQEKWTDEIIPRPEFKPAQDFSAIARDAVII